MFYYSNSRLEPTAAASNVIESPAIDVRQFSVSFGLPQFRLWQRWTADVLIGNQIWP
jgi:hypothetical protein